MINPSAHSWIQKYLALSSENLDVPQSIKDFYVTLRKSGFIYGHIHELAFLKSIQLTGWKPNEISKIALLDALFGLYTIQSIQKSKVNFVTSLQQFYCTISLQKGNWTEADLHAKYSKINLETVLNERVKTNENTISQKFSHILTNALLFVDVLAYYKFLNQKEISHKYIVSLEELIMSVVTLALQSKINKSQYDELLYKLFETSLRFGKHAKVNLQNTTDLNIDLLTHKLEKYYLYDLAVMTLWADQKMDVEELQFLENLAQVLQLKPRFTQQSILFSNEFIETYKNDIQYFKFTNPVKHFYEQASQNVAILINRNQKRLTKELLESKELLQLLAKSTTKELDAKEKKKVKKQLLDICKTIPSLTIFLLPGGGFLLPLLVKYIPQLLPSAFNENTEDTNS
ncbi:LETM1-like protein [Flavobacterium croceum DSM 17960]|uniref:LETM1-like protein n=1 Tax=Flavobacterium croceum DSM 17960 TaxID=1121886 RepID=A0A2S4N8N7_9FLAO|nr:LETM1-related biofilm-associated protein [Flavobacterium croceum]POS02051.1 LETM1-like protein [Flavobacterium croceum DSM 17960]